MSELCKIVLTAVLIFFSFISGAQVATCGYLQELSIRCLQRELTPNELSYFPECKDTMATRIAFSYFVMEQQDFINRADLILRMELLQGTTIRDMREAIQDFDLIAFSQPDNTLAAKNELARLYELYRIPKEFMTGSLSIEDIYSINFDNWIYDQQNMGLNNFINSTFSYAMGRPPTHSEFNNAYAMLTGVEGKLFFQKGDSRQDFFRILTTNENFLEKQINFWYYYFLFQYPSLNEVYDIMKSILESEDEDGLDLDAIIRYIIVHKLTV